MQKVSKVSIHAPWEGCDNEFTLHTTSQVVSIHAPWEGCDYLSLLNYYYPQRFQFTHPGKGATTEELFKQHLKRVSIHAPWEGCDYYLIYFSAKI